MRTKILLIAAATFVLGVVSSNAQVYSANVVGYYTLTLTNGYNLVAHQLDYDGTGLNNTIQNTFGTSLPSGTKVLAFNPTNASYPTVNFVAGQTWTGGTATNSVNGALAPGYGVFINIPAATHTPTNIVIVGTVMQGSLVTPLYTGIQIASSQIPIAGQIQSALSYVPGHGDKVYQWVATSQGYPVTRSYVTGTTWTGGQPSLAVGEAFFLSTTNVAWSTNFTVQ